MLTHLLLQHTPSRQNAGDSQQDPLSDTLANLDLIFQWIVEACFTADTLNPDVVTQGTLNIFFLPHISKCHFGGQKLPLGLKGVVQPQSTLRFLLLLA